MAGMTTVQLGSGPIGNDRMPVRHGLRDGTMGPVVLIDPAVDGPVRRKRRYAIPALLVAGWGGLLAYSVAYLTEDMPFRQAAAERTEAAPPALPDDGPRRIVVVAAPEAAAAESSKPPADPPAPVQAVAAAVPPPAARQAPAPANAEYVGVWGPTLDACGARSRRRGYIPATITAERATAGRTICSFRDGHRVGNAWVVAAECSDRGRRWSSQVRLVVDGDRLTWSSSRGTSAYVRCSRRAG